MDINGAKALKKRLGPNGADDASPAPADLDIPDDAPPVYHWLGVEQLPATRTSDEDDAASENASLFRRLTLSFH